MQLPSPGDAKRTLGAGRPHLGGERAVTLLHEARELLDDAVDLRRRLHRHPEVGLDLPRTQTTVVEALRDLGLEPRTGRALTSVVATFEGVHPGPTVLLRADMDALPVTEATGLGFASEIDGVMHACGHDAHMAMLVTATRLLARHRDDIHGRVLLVFQPGEEGHGGAQAMLDEGLLDGERLPSAAFAIHVHPQLPSGVVATRAGAIMASADTIQIDIRGRGGHASAPHAALDPIPPAAEIVLALQTMVARRFNVFDPVVLTVTRLEAGSADNVIPERAHLLGTVRALSNESRARVLELAGEVVEAVGRAHGVDARLTVIPSYPPTVNDPAMAAVALEAAGHALGPENSTTMDAPLMTAEDFSLFLQRVPGCLVLLGASPPDVGEPHGLHSNRMVLDESAMANGIAFLAAAALRQLS